MATKRTPRPRDPVQLGKLMVDIMTGQTPDSVDDGKHPEAVERGRAGGAVGGKVRAERLTAEQRMASAKKAAASRWDQAKEDVS